MQKTHKFWAKVTASTLALAFIPASFVFAGSDTTEKGNRPDAATMTAIEKAMDANDYATWKSLLPTQMQSKVTEAKFQEMIAKHKEMETKRAEMEAHRAAVETAITAGNYETWKAEVTKENPKSPLLTKITADNFSQYKEMYGYREKAQAIAKTLGIEGRGEGMGMGGGEGMGMMGGGHGPKHDKGNEANEAQE
ncbi:MAG: hypothetical protein PHO48_02100 [Candidatus Gracilibacteria bacterium]|nr:hypothetical protein [Candidatus Gracilibacteria bacterium]MDD5178848.1 hypothetical protein [Candidatus Gracilibacteria bacterium]